MSNTRRNILDRLRSNQGKENLERSVYLPDYGWSQEEKIIRLTEKMQQVRTEIYRMPRDQWINWLNSELPKRNLKNVLVGNTDNARKFTQHANSLLQIHHYERVIEDWKDDLFNSIDVSITDTLGGIAESGSLMLWPDSREPRLMSLVPPVHIALLDSSRIFETFAQAIQQQKWTEQMPTNALLISGPSKTADIQQILAYGIHGPKKLVVLVLD